MQKLIPFFDTHQDIADIKFYTAGTDFLEKTNTNQGSNNYNIPTSNQSDYTRLTTAGGKAIFAVSCVVNLGPKNNITAHPNHFHETLQQLNYYHDLKKRAQGKINFILNKKDLDNWDQNLNFLLGIEGADSINNLVNLEAIYNLGVRSIGLTYNAQNDLAGGAASKGNLTKTGETVLKKMNELGILLDLAHINEKSFFSCLRVTKKPAIISHTACQSITDNFRNITNEQIKAIKKNNGAIGIGAIPRFVGGHEVNNIVKHYLHVIKLIGIDHVILGTDLGAILERPMIKDFQDVTDTPKLFEAFKQAGLTEDEIKKIAYKNILRILDQTLPSN